MLDFYFISDDAAKQNNRTSEPDFAGALDDKTFKNLQNKGIIDARFDFYSDFHWPKVFLEKMRREIDIKQIHTDSDVVRLLQLIDPAVARECGLIAYCD